MPAPASLKLSDYIAQVKNVARPNRFTLEVIGTNAEFVGIPENFIFLVKAASIPKKTITGPEIKYRGMTVTLAGDYIPEPLSITFLNDREWLARTFMEDWMDSIVNTSENSSLLNDREQIDSYRTGSDIIINQIGDNDTDILAEYVFHSFVPLDISEIELAHDNENTIEEFTVTGNYISYDRI